MPRTGRAARGGYCYHVLNRGNGRSEVFHKDGDYAAFIKLLRQARERLPMRILGYCLMPNHFHMLLWPHKDGDLGRWMQWLMTSHVRRYHQHYASSGHVWQGRFKAFPIEKDDHLLTVLRYVERNPLRAELVSRVQDWRWSSVAEHLGESGESGIVTAGPVPLPADWIEHVNQPLTEAELARMRESVNRGAPYGEKNWVTATAKALGLQASIRPRGRPRKK